MILRRMTFALFAALLLGACTTPAAQNAVTMPPTVQSTDVPTATSPTSAPTEPPAVEQASAPTRNPPTTQPTSVLDSTEQSVTASAQSRPTPQPSATLGQEILFLRQGTLTAFDIATRKERQLTDQVQDFAATPDGAMIAVLRGQGATSEIWTVRRDGSDLRQLTKNNRAEATLAWAPDGLSLVFGSPAIDRPYTRDWQGWSQWCAASEVRLLNLADAAELTLGAGCDPAFSPDGRRIAYAAPPTTEDPDFPDNPPLIRNSIRLINRQGKNGWDFAKAQGPEVAAPHAGRLVYAPAWSPDSRQVVYQRFIGYQALVDISLSEIAGSFEGNGKLVNSGAGWLLPARFAPGGRSLAISENNYSDARGFGGYDNWSVTVIQLQGTREVMLPSGTLEAIGQRVDLLRRGQAAAWSPDGEALAVELPPGWNAELPPHEPTGVDESPGEIWRWRPGRPPEERLIEKVDFASPLAWLPASPKVAASPLGYQLVYPADWQLAGETEFEERVAIAPDGMRMISAALVPEHNLANPAADELFALFVAAGGKHEAPVTLPDGSVYRAFAATTPDGQPAAGAIRVARSSGGKVVAMLYRTTPERWPFERALAQSLLAHSGLAQ